MNTPINPYAGGSHQGSVPPHYGSVQGKGQVDNSDPTASTSGSTVQIIPVQDEDGNIYEFTPHVPIAYDDTFKESSDIRGFSFMATVNDAIYKYTHFALYAGLTLIIAPIMSFAWAIIFAISHIFIIWLIQPSIKIFYLWMRVSGLMVTPAVRLFLDPVFKSFSLIFSGIKGQFKMNAPDITLNVKTTQV